VFTAACLICDKSYEKNNARSYATTDEHLRSIQQVLKSDTFITLPALVRETQRGTDMTTGGQRWTSQAMSGRLVDRVPRETEQRRHGLWVLQWS